MVEYVRVVIVLYIVVLLRKLVLLRSICGDFCKGGGGIVDNEYFIDFVY